MNERLPHLDREYVGLGDYPRFQKVVTKGPTSVMRIDGRTTNTVIQNPSRFDVSVDLINGSRNELFVGAGENETVVTMEGGMVNQVVVWNPDRSPVEVKLKGGSLSRVCIYVCKDEAESLEEYKEKKVKVSDDLDQDRVRVREFDHGTFLSRE